MHGDQALATDYDDRGSSARDSQDGEIPASCSTVVVNGRS
jgi:hypothetical protein